MCKDCMLYAYHIMKQLQLQIQTQILWKQQMGIGSKLILVVQQTRKVLWEATFDNLSSLRKYIYKCK